MQQIIRKFIVSQWVHTKNSAILFVELMLFFNNPVLHPRHKLKYFEHAGWEPDWIAAAKDIVWAEFDRSYAKPREDDDEDVAGDAATSEKQKANIFDDLPALSAPKIKELRDELDQYLSSDPEHVKDVLKWWTEKRAMYPALSRMALDYLSIPGELPFPNEFKPFLTSFTYIQPLLLM